MGRGDASGYCGACDKMVPLTRSSPMLASGLRRIGWHCIACGCEVSSERVRQPFRWWWLILPLAVATLAAVWAAGGFA